MDKLGLTKYIGDNEKKYAGYNFAFEALGRDANWSASQGKYGKHAVLFQNSGVHCYHYGDEETQIVFYGADVSPKNIIYLRNEGGDWQVMPAYEIRGRDYLFTG